MLTDLPKIECRSAMYNNTPIKPHTLLQSSAIIMQ